MSVYNEIKTVRIDEDDYPPLLRLVKGAPETLYYRGDIRVCHRTCLAVVGARKGTAYGRWAAGRIGERAAACGLTVVSGMAYGIDTAAHKGALEGGGCTAAVFGCGVDICYPESNRKLMEQIIETGVAISEQPPGTQPFPGCFPARNRIISGLSIGTVVVEAGLNSGSLITAGTAAEQGRELFAVPGNINNIYSIGANKLIQDGAIPVVVIDDIFDYLGVERPLPEGAAEKLGKDEQLLVKIIAESGECTLDRLCRVTGKPLPELSALVTILEMKGLVQTALGKIFVAKYEQ